MCAHCIGNLYISGRFATSTINTYGTEAFILRMNHYEVIEQIVFIKAFGESIPRLYMAQQMYTADGQTDLYGCIQTSSKI